MPELTGGQERVELQPGYAVTAPGLRGWVELLPGGTPGTRAREESGPLLDEALARTEMESVRTIEITATRVPEAGRGMDLRDAEGKDALLLEVPDLGADTGQVVLSVDELGAITWHFPLDDGQIQPPSTRGAGGTKRFYIRRDTPSAPPSSLPGHRALFGALGRKLLKVLVYPITDVLLGKPAEIIAERWEGANRSYGIRRFTPDDYRLAPGSASDRQRLELTRAEVERLGQGRALLFIHGTFSTAPGAFQDLPPTLMEKLHRNYDGRVFAFNHFTLAHDPERNVRELLDGLKERAPDTRIEADVVCHSRGGLVARTIDQGSLVFGLDTDRLRLHRVVFAGAPNQGTLLAHPDHMVNMIDRLTTALNLFPPGGVADILEGILIGVKIIGHGALRALAGIQSMHPDGRFLERLNAATRTQAEYYAIAANYEPKDAGLRWVLTGAADALLDRIFSDAENDLVVPERGVYQVAGCASFPVPADHCIRLPDRLGVMHTGLFASAEVQRQLSEWLL